MLRLILSCILLLAGETSSVAQVRQQDNSVSSRTAPRTGSCLIDKLRFSHQGERTRLVLDMVRAVPYDFERADSVGRVRLAGMDCAHNPPSVDIRGSHIEGLGFSHDGHGGTVLILHIAARSHFKHFALPPDGSRGYRIVVDVHSEQTGNTEAGRKIVIAVDAGHGGSDSGAVAKDGYQEKHLVLAVAHYLVQELNSKQGLQGVLIRNTDIYLPLEERVSRARALSADVFLSLHGDAFEDAAVSGVSVFALSAHAATRAVSRHLSDRHRHDVPPTTVPPRALETISPHLPAALANLSMRFALARSMEMGGYLLRALRTVAKVHRHQVKQAGFVVLQPIDVPSVLVELGFLSHPAEASKLRQADYQRKLSVVLARGLEGYFREHPPAGSYFAELDASER